MKNKLTVLTFFVLLLASFTSQAQEVTKFRFGLGLDAGLPIEEFKDHYMVGVGLDIRMTKGIVPNLDATFTGGFICFFSRDYTEKATDTTEMRTFLPVKLGLRYMLTKNWYVTGESGVNFVSTYVKDSGLTDFKYFKYKYEVRPHFSYTLGVGGRFGDFDIGARYEDVKVSKFVALRIGYDI